MEHGTYLLELAEKALAEGNDSRAMDLAKDARKSFGSATASQAAAPNGPTAKLTAPNPPTTVIATAPPITKRTLTKAEAAERDAAIVAIVAAQQALADATGRDHPEAKRKKAQSLITIAEGWLDRDGFVQAKSFAESAQKELVPEPPRPVVAEKATEKPIAKVQKERPVEEKPIEVRTIEEKPVVKQVVVQPVVEQRVVRQSVVERSVVASPSRRSRSSRHDEPQQDDWLEPYRKVIEALSMRDRVKRLATTPATRATLASGMNKLANAQAAWRHHDFREARDSADSAIALFSTILSEPPSPAPNAPLLPAPVSDPKAADPIPSVDMSAQRESASYRNTESLVREATALVEVCEHEKCAERNVGLFASGKAAVTSARVALESARYDLATELAKEAKIKLQASLDTPKSTILAAIDTAEQKKRRIDAEDAIREANVQHQLCEQKKCTGKDIESWLRAESAMGAARAAFADSEFDRAKAKADDATNILKAAFAAQAAIPPPKEPPHIEIPPGVTNVVARGNALIVTPAFDFTSASPILTPASAPSIDTLAKVLLHNKDRIRSISVIGFTDNRGAAALNVSLSQQRAKAVADGLIAAGVAASTVTSMGRGPESPIADNATGAGRSANRRVEIRVEFVDAGK
jgi:outer membrane protein OmpA-like peptidoglycan-associated protein